METGSELIRQVGTSLFADRWQTPLAHELGVSDRLVRYWASGERELPREVAERALQILIKRGELLNSTAALVKLYIDRA